MLEFLENHTSFQSIISSLFIMIALILVLRLVKSSSSILRTMSHFDHLIKFGKSPSFFKRANKRLHKSQPNDHYVLFLIDIDNFHTIANRIGSKKTQFFLNDISRLPTTHLDERPLCYHWHSDSIACLSKLSHTNQTPNYIAQIHRHFRHCALRHNINTTCCIGVAQHRFDGINAETLMTSAIDALSEAKKKSKHTEYYDPKRIKIAEQYQEMARELSKAINEKKIEIVFQPKYHINQQYAVGVEVLSRWTHDRYGIVSPETFITLAEKHLLCRNLTALILEKAAHQLRVHDLLNKGLASVSVNISAVELTSIDDMNYIIEFLKSDPEFANVLCLEITETAILKDIGQCTVIIQALKQYGVSFSIDDFGVGYTSFGVLNQLNVDEIKLDRSYIETIETDHRVKVITSGIIDIANGLGIHVVAEGVNSAQQLAILQTLNCEQVQGYHLSPPLTAVQLKEVRFVKEESSSSLYDEINLKQKISCFT